jgi:hypothetical protein
MEIMRYQVKPIPEKIAVETRERLVSPQYKSLKADVSVANGYGPCRSCLRVFDQGNEHRIYFTYNSFDGRSNLPDPGPVFIHRDECRGFDGDGIPPDLLELPVLFEAFGDESRLIVRRLMNASEADAQIKTMFTDKTVRFINMRNAEAGCFIATIERI